MFVRRSLFLLTLLSLIAVFLIAACTPRGGGRGGGGSDDDDAGDDDDATDDDDAGAGGDPENASLPCSGGGLGVWSFEVTESANVYVGVDTIAAATAFDPAFEIYFGSYPGGENWGSGDDEEDCMFPPPSFACPSFEGSATTGTYFVEVSNLGDCVGDEGGYRVFATSESAGALTLRSVAVD